MVLLGTHMNCIQIIATTVQTYTMMDIASCWMCVCKMFSDKSI